MAKKQPPKPKHKQISQNLGDLQQQLVDQLNFLISSCLAFDDGNTTEAKRLAATIRVLVHDTDSSISVFKQLGIKTTFFNSGHIFSEDTEPSVRGLAKLSLVNRLLGNSLHQYAPIFEKPDFNSINPEGMVDFKAWWHQPIIADKEGNVFTRKSIVLSMANQDGGSHVDPGLEETYYKLTRLNSVQDELVIIEGEITVESVANLTPIPVTVSPAYYTVRQIAHEILVGKLDHKKTQWPETIYPYNNSRYDGIHLANLDLYESE